MEKEKIKQILLESKREGMEKYVEYLESSGFFNSAASTKFHGNYEGGLFDHSINLYKILKDKRDKYKLLLTEFTMLFVAISHDLCKVGLYIGNNNIGFRWNNNHPKGHALLSIHIIKQFIELTNLEEEMIKFHMGFYGTTEFNSERGEYTLSQLTTAFNDKRIKLTYFSDDEAAQCLDIKK